MNSSFIEKCISGDTSLDEIDDYIDEWHDSDSDINLELHEFLGMSWEEYSLWAVKPSLLAEILNHRKQDVGFKKLVLPSVLSKQEIANISPLAAINLDFSSRNFGLVTK